MTPTQVADLLPRKTAPMPRRPAGKGTTTARPPKRSAGEAAGTAIAEQLTGKVKRKRKARKARGSAAAGPGGSGPPTGSSLAATDPIGTSTAIVPTPLASGMPANVDRAAPSAHDTRTRKARKVRCEAVDYMCMADLQ